MSILIVDDREENLFALEVALEPLGQRIVRARSGHDALLAVLAEQFAVILMDIRMPGMDGFETLELLRTRERSAHIPIIFLTAYPDKQDLPRSDRFGAVDCMQKPYDPEALRAKVAVFVHLEMRVAERTRELAEANVLLHREIERRKGVEARLVEQAHHDVLTGLANRKLLIEHLHRALARWQRQPSARFAVMLIDLDRFKQINDTRGHLAGDRLLVEVGKRLERCLRAVDTAARLGGDEFAVLLDQLDEGPNQGSEVALAAERIAARIHEALALPISIDDDKVDVGALGDVAISASIGIAVASDRHARADDLLRDADTALYRAKARGRARTEVFDQAMQETALAHLRDEADLRDAIERDRIRVVYQPIVHLATGAIVAFEALARWQHPTRGEIEPAQFIPLAEETGLVHALGHRLLDEACEQLATWRRERPALVLNVNLSAVQLARGGLAAHLAAALNRHALPISALELELTEATMGKLASHTGELAQLRADGFALALDDYGTGYSCLATLPQLAVSTLKIDRSFVAPIGTPEDRPEIVRAIASLARGLELRLVAEGIETAAQLARLKLIGCEYGQGFFFSAPVDATRATALLAGTPTSSRVTMR